MGHTLSVSISVTAFFAGILGASNAVGLPAPAISCSAICHQQLSGARIGPEYDQRPRLQAEATRIFQNGNLEPYRALRATVRGQERRAEEADYLESALTVISAGSDVGSLYIPGLFGEMLGGLGTFTGVLAEGASRIRDASNEANDSLFTAGLLELYNRDAEILRNLEGRSAAEVHVALFGENGSQGLLAGTRAGAVASESTRVAMAALPYEILNQRIAAVSSGLVEVHADVIQLGQAVNSLNDRVDRFEVETRNELLLLNRRQEALAALTNSVADLSVDNMHRIGTLERLYFQSLTAAERLDLITKGGLAGVSLSDEEIDALQWAADIDAVRSYANQIASSAGDIAAIGNVLGLEISEEMAAVQTLANVAANGALLLTGEPLTMLAGAGGLARMFGGGGRGGDSALAREISALRSEIRANHLETMEALRVLSVQVDQGFRRVLDRQSVAMDQLIFLSRSLDHLATQNLRQCEEVVRFWRLQEGEDHDARAERFEDELDSLGRCRVGIGEAFTVRESAGARFHPIFEAQAARRGSDLPSSTESVNANDALAFSTWRDNVFLPTSRYTFQRLAGLINEAPSCPRDQVIFTALTGSNQDDGALRHLLAETAADCAAGRRTLFRAYASGTQSDPVDVQFVMSTPIDADSVVRYARSALAATDVYEFIIQDQRVRRVSDLVGGQPPSTTRAERQSDHIADVLTMAIAQSSMLAGDLVLDLIADDIEAALAAPERRNLASINPTSWTNCDAPRAQPAADYFNALCVLSRNPSLQYNFVRHWVRTRLVGSGIPTYRRYAAGLAYDRPALIRSALPADLPVESCGTEHVGANLWCLALPTAGLSAHITHVPRDVWQISLPPVDEVQSDRLLYLSPRRSELIALRAAGRDRAAAYRLSRTLPADQLILYHASIWTDAAEPNQEPLNYD